MSALLTTQVRIGTENSKVGTESTDFNFMSDDIKQQAGQTLTDYLKENMLTAEVNEASETLTIKLLHP